MLKLKTNIDFMSKRKLAYMASAALVVLSLVLLFTRGLNLGIDFTGGTVVEVGYAEPVQLDTVRAALINGGYERAVVQYFGTSQDVLIRLAPREGENRADLADRVLQVLRTDSTQSVEMRRVEFVGPQVGEELRERGGLAFVVAIFGILLYVWVRFIHWGFSIGAVIALIHDAVLTLGYFTIVRLQFDLTTLAAVLAIAGYSLNDTIVVYDRIRESFRKMRKATTVEVINTAINQTLSRTLMTSGTTLIVLICLLVFGGEAIKSFSEALIVGVIVGTYSSIYIASPILINLGVSKQDMMPVKKEGAELDQRP
jgi:preprotein translocase subunit SecF